MTDLGRNVMRSYIYPTKLSHLAFDAIVLLKSY